MKQKSAVEELFEISAREIEAKTDQAPIEIELSQLQTLTINQHEQIAILLDLADEEIAIPGAADKYLNLEQIRSIKAADNSTLINALKQFERIVQAPFKNRSLRPPATSTSYRAPTARAAMKIVPLIKNARLSIICIDALTAAFIAIPITISLLFIERIILNSDSNGFPFRQTIDYYPIAASYLKNCFICAILYQIYTSVRKKRSLGFRVKRAKLVSLSGTPASLDQQLVRALLIPLSCVCLTPLAIMLNKTPISDLLTKSTIARL